MPSLALAAAIWLLSRRYIIFVLLQLPGTLCHELVRASKWKLTISASELEMDCAFAHFPGWHHKI